MAEMPITLTGVQQIPDEPRFNVKAERNSKGWNYEATVTGAHSPEEALRLLQVLTSTLEAQYGRQNQA